MTVLITNNFFGRTLAMLSGGLLTLAFSPFDFSIIAIIALFMLFCLGNGIIAREAFIRGYLFGFACFGIGVNWLHISINLFGGVNLLGALAATYLLVAFLALYPAICLWLANRFFANVYLYAVPLLWILTEWMRGWFLTGFPWLNIGTSQTDSILSAYIPIIGDYGTSLVVAVIASTMLLIIQASRLARSVAILVPVLLFGSAQLLQDTNWTIQQDKQLDVALVQGAIPQEIKWSREQRQPTLEKYLSLTAEHWDKDIIVWPETAIPSLYHHADDFLRRIEQEKSGGEAILLSGIAYQELETRSYFNSILLIDDTHRFYHKHHLVPFGEYLPLKSLLGGLLRFLQIPMSDFSAGNPDEKIFQTGKATLGMSICYEDAYAEEMRKAMPEAEIFINVSNDAWFGDSLAPQQHLQIARVRAMENGRYLLRATNTGISAIIDEKGNIVSQSPQFIAHSMTGTVKLFQGMTPFARWGNLPVMFLSLLILIVVYVRTQQVNRQNRTSSRH